MAEDESIEKPPVVPVGDPTDRAVFWQSLICLLVIMFAAGIVTTISKSGVSLVGTLVSSQPSSWKVLTTLAGILVLVFLALKSVRDTRMLSAIMSLAIILGLTFGTDVLLGPAAGTIIFCLAVVIYFSDPWVVLYDLLLSLGLAGICAAIGPVFQPEALLLVLCVVAIYDVTAVHLSGKSILFMRQLPSRRAFFSFVLPLHWRGLQTRVGKAAGNLGSFGLRGVADLLLPTIFAVSVLWHHGLVAAGSVMLGATLFPVLIHVTASWPRPAPILPPLALGSAIGYLAFLLVI